MGTLNPTIWTTTTGGTASAIGEVLKPTKPAIAGGISYCGAAITGWGIGTSAGCAVACDADPSSY